jgi:peroxiredoxin
MLSEGSAAPDFQLDGWRLKEALSTGPVLLVFFKISCPTCQFALPFVQRLADSCSEVKKEGSGESLTIVAVSQDDAKGTGQFHTHFDIRLKTLLDERPYPVSNLYGLRNVPTLYLIEPDGVISMAVSGFSKAHLESLGARFGGIPFREGESVPAMRPG